MTSVRQLILRQCDRAIYSYLPSHNSSYTDNAMFFDAVQRTRHCNNAEKPDNFAVSFWASFSNFIGYGSVVNEVLVCAITVQYVFFSGLRVLTPTELHRFIALQIESCSR